VLGKPEIEGAAPVGVREVGRCRQGVRLKQCHFYHPFTGMIDLYHRFIVFIQCGAPQ
jgi:hypothetical protein